MCAVIRKGVSGRKLNCCRVVTIDAVFPEDDYILITGKVINPKGQIIPHAAIVIFALVESDIVKTKKYLGVTFSDDKGWYGISVPRNLGISYEFKAYGEI